MVNIVSKLDEVGYFVEDQDKGLIPSPLILTLEKATNNIRTSASQLGLTVDSRMNMQIKKIQIISCSKVTLN